MKIYFCDGCNESIPLDDIQAGQATTIKGKLFCRNCIPLGVTAPGGPAPEVRTRTSPVLIVVVLLLVGWALWRELPGLMGSPESGEEATSEVVKKRGPSSCWFDMSGSPGGTSSFLCESRFPRRQTHARRVAVSRLASRMR